MALGTRRTLLKEWRGYLAWNDFVEGVRDALRSFRFRRRFGEGVVAEWSELAC